MTSSFENPETSDKDKVMEEPSVLDYLKSRLNPWQKEKIRIPAEEEKQVEPEAVPLPVEITEPGKEEAELPQVEPSLSAGMERPPALPAPWRMVLALLLAVGAQIMLDPGRRAIGPGVFLYVTAGFFAGWSFWSGEWRVARLQEDGLEPVESKYNPWMLLAIVVLIIATFIAFGVHVFNGPDMFIWGVTLAVAILAFWRPRGIQPGWLKRLSNGIHLSPWVFLMLGVFGLSFIYRFAQLSQIPGEPFSDHAEKLLDVMDVLRGQLSVFFPRNTGREAIQFYLTVAIIKTLGTGVSFISLKIGTALIGFLTLPYIYLLGKEVGNKWVGLLAMLLVGTAYWPNVESRIGLRFPLYMAFVAPTLFYLMRGLRTRKRNDFILSGIALGIGLHGYSPIRFLPFVVLAAIGIYMLHKQAQGNRKGALIGLEVLVLLSLICFLPLFRYALDLPEQFGYRALTRLGTAERSFPGPVGLIFLSNLWKAWVMFFWDNGNIWVHSIPGRPALDTLTAGLYFLGSVLLLVRYIRQRNWTDLFLLVSVPLLMMPSILSLAFPDENPSLNRTDGAVIPVFIIAAIALEGFLRTLSARYRAGLRHQWPVVLVSAVLIFPILTSNYDLVFNQFKNQFLDGAWNTSQMGQVIHGFATSIGDPDSAYVIPYPYWVDTRLVGIQAGYPTKDYALAPGDLPTTQANPRAKLFIINTEDTTSLAALQQMYPGGTLSTYQSGRTGKDFLIDFVPPQRP